MIAQGDIQATVTLSQAWPQLVVATFTVASNFAILKIMLDSCRKDKAELAATISTAATLAEEVRRERDKHG